MSGFIKIRDLCHRPVGFALAVESVGQRNSAEIVLIAVVHDRRIDVENDSHLPRLACLQALRPLGVAIAIGFAGGAWEPVDPARLVGRNIGVQGFYLGRLLGFRAELVQEEVHELLALWRRGAIKPVIGAELPLDQATDAHELIASRKSTGKVVLVP